MSHPPHGSIPGANSRKVTVNVPAWRGLAWAMGLLLFPAPAHAEIAVTLPPLAGLIRMLDARAEVFCLLPPHADAHHVRLGPKRMQRLRAAKWLVRSSQDDGAWRGLKHAPRVLDLWPRHDHAWLDPERVRRVLPRLAAALIQAAPERRAQIMARLAAAERECRRLERRLRRALAPYRKAGVILQHRAWRGLLHRFRVPVRAVLESHHHGRELRPRTLERALAVLRENPKVALWGDARSANRALLWLARHAPGQRPILLGAVGECGLTWPALMRRNLALLQRS